MEGQCNNLATGTSPGTAGIPHILTTALLIYLIVVSFLVCAIPSDEYSADISHFSTYRLHFSPSPHF